MRVGLDTNLLACAEGVNGTDRMRQAAKIFRRFDGDELLIPLQVLGELFNVLTRKGGRSRSSAAESVREWQQGYLVVGTSGEIIEDALRLSVDHQLRIWDAVICSAAASAGCTTLLSEDMQDGFTWRGLTVRNPFRTLEGH